MGDMPGARLRSWGMHGKGASLLHSVRWAGDAGGGAARALAERSEPQLAEQALRGDREAWGELVARHDHRVIVALLARGIRLDQARELAHQAWIRLIDQQRAGRLERLELPGLAIRQAVFLALDAARRRELAAHSLDHAAARAVHDAAASAEDRLIRREQLQRAQAELARCSPSARRLFALLYRNPGMRHAEAARQLGLSVQRVRQILCEVRARLRAAIEEASDDRAP
jgi:RNA polymerase sigma-70 factor (ECF subfamily)